MNCRIFFYGLILIRILSGCGTPKIITSDRSDALKAADTGNYSQAFESWKLFFDQQAKGGMDVLPEDYAMAAKSAFSANQYDQAVQWFDQARYGGYSDPEMYVRLASLFRSRDNLSREITALKFYYSHFPAHKDSIIMRNRFFEVCVAAEDYDEALNLWEKMDQPSRNKKEYLDACFLINRKRENKEACDSLVSLLLAIDPEHIGSLEWNAEKYYWQGENRYQQEMEKYERNKTTKQYQVLLKELDKVTADFKQALTWFELLWKIEPGEKYAPFFANIYARFGNQDKASYFKTFIKKQ